MILCILELALPPTQFCKRFLGLNYKVLHLLTRCNLRSLQPHCDPVSRKLRSGVQQGQLPDDDLWQGKIRTGAGSE